MKNNTENMVEQNKGLENTAKQEQTKQNKDNVAEGEEVLRTCFKKNKV